ncbi:MAG: hypothetical protein Q8R55_07330, partial [Candidatus Taylorbacteria bacterium]|nr:hypothetical protein [Candidatus Taylorbacteria bacterium]
YLWTTSRKPNIEDKQNLFSIDLFAKMVKFVSTLPDRKDAFKPWDVPSVLKILSDEKFKEVRRKFAHWLLFEQKEFSIYADGCEESLEMILKDFPEDQKLTSKAKRILAKYLEWKKEDTRETKSIKNAESRALESLKA